LIASGPSTNGTGGRGGAGSAARSFSENSPEAGGRGRPALSARDGLEAVRVPAAAGGIGAGNGEGNGEGTGVHATDAMLTAKARRARRTTEV